MTKRNLFTKRTKDSFRLYKGKHVKPSGTNIYTTSSKDLSGPDLDTKNLATCHEIDIKIK